jgi:transcriptional regulator with XRE-family HTH domain
MDFDFVERLRKTMEEKGMTASELSRASGVGKSDISYYLKGKYLPKQDKVFMLAKALHVNPGWLMTGVEQVEESRPIFTPDSDKWRLIITNMTLKDYEAVRDAFNRTERRLREEGKL